MAQKSRRDFIKLIIGLTSLGFLSRSCSVAYMNRKRPSQIGTTFSQLQCNYLNIDYQKAFQNVLALGFDTIRLCAYWNEIEPVETQFNFSTLDWLIEQSQKHSVKVVLAIGMKTPRWPEFHFPAWVEKQCNTQQTEQPLDSDSWLRDKSLTYLERLVRHVKPYNIFYWQIENEALNKPGVASGRYLSSAFIQQEIALVKRIAGLNQNILLTNAIGMLPIGNDDEQALEDSLSFANAIGLNVYTKVPLDETQYIEAYPFYWDKLTNWRSRITKLGIQAWVAEAQAEPWEWNRLVATDKLNYPSASPESSVELAMQLGGIGYETVLLWGCEYWYWQKLHGNCRWFQAVDELISNSGNRN